MKKGISVAVVGATGAVGREMLLTLVQRRFPISEIRALASERSAGQALEFGDEEITCEQLQEDSFEGVDIALFSAGGSISEKFAPHATKSGAIVIDNSSHFRMDPNVSLIVPEVNGDALKKHIQSLSRSTGLIIANPNCSTVQLVVALKPLMDRAGLKRVVVSTYQSVSGAGQKGMEELWEQTVAIFNGEDPECSKFPHQIAFNCIPHIDIFLEGGYSREEVKVINESRKILSSPDLRITATAVRVPVFSCHGESVNVELERPLSPDEARDLLRASPGIIVMDDPNESIYPLNIDLTGTDATYIGRIRADESVENGLNMWIVADNLRKGAALNAVQIAEIAIDSGRFGNIS